ncbi:sugar ABC transporter permease [Anaerolineae bacterium CFX9]|nr:sugar ABC transporter permease [Anaerolineae bacterium CFX9]
MATNAQVLEEQEYAGRGAHTREDRIIQRVFLSPAVILLLALSIFPLLWSLAISFTNVQRGTTNTSSVSASVLQSAIDPLLEMPGVDADAIRALADEKRQFTAALQALITAIPDYSEEDLAAGLPLLQSSANALREGGAAVRVPVQRMDEAIQSLTAEPPNLTQGAQRIQQAASTLGRLTVAEPTGFMGLGFDFTFNNYVQVFRDAQLWNAARNTLTYVILGLAIQYTIGFGLALLLQQDFRGRWFFRLIFMLPMMITPVAAAYSGRMMFAGETFAPLAQLLRLFNITVPWLTDTGVAPITITLIDSWQWIPFMTLVLLAGLQAIPDEIYEAARVDGATSLQIFWRITFPIMLPISFTIILIRGLEIFKIVDIIRVTTGGGPGNSTESLVMYVYNIALTFGNYGYAAAVSYVLLVMVIIFSTVFIAVSRRVNRAQLGA